MAGVADRWDAGPSYEDFMGRWSRELAPKFVEWLGISEDEHWLDVGCGTGALTDAIHRLANPASIIACDPAQPLIEYARAKQASDRASFVVAGTGSLPRRDGGYDCVTSCLALNFFPEPIRAVEEMRDLTAVGGTLSSCVWDYSGRMEFLSYFWNAASRIDLSALGLDEGVRFPICRPDALTELFRNSGLLEVCCDPIEIATEFSSFGDYWRSFQGGSGPAPSYVASLDDQGRKVLATELENALPRDPDGSVPLVARAWAVRGNRQ